MNELYLEIVHKVKIDDQSTDEEIDNLMVDSVALDMKEKLCKKREQGRHGWHIYNSYKGCTNAILLRLLKAHIDKGDMINIINFAAMIHVRTALYGDKA